MSHLVGTILGADYNRAHFNHIHAEPPTKQRGTPPTRNPGMTPGIAAIYGALEREFGKGAYFASIDHHWEPNRFVIDEPGIGWVHMGGWNRRYIGGTTTWSQHAWWNGLDIGPYLGLDQQRPFRDFLQRHDRATEERDMAVLTDDEQRELRTLIENYKRVNSTAWFPQGVIPVTRQLPKAVAALQREIDAIEAGAGSGEVARLRQEFEEVQALLRKAGAV